MSSLFKKKNIAISAAALMMLTGVPMISMAASASALKSRADGVYASFQACMSSAGSNKSKVSKCKSTAQSQLASLRKQAAALDDSDRTAALAHIDGIGGNVNSAVAVARPKADAKPAEAMAEESDDRMLGGATSAPAKEYKAVTKSSSTRSTRRYDKAKKKRPSKPAYRPAPAPRVAAEPRGSEDYKDYGVNKMTDTSEDNLSTFAIDVDTGAYVIARRKINAGGLPPKASVRVEEFVNYFRYEYAQPKSGPFAVSLEAAPSPFTAKKDHYLMRVGVQGKALTSKERKPVHLTFLVDVSGSMNTPDKLGLAQESLKILTNNLKPGDTVALVTYAGNTRVVLEPTGMYERGKILNAIGELTAGGSTAMASGMDLAYKQALTNFKRDHVNRVIVLSDGDTNIGPRNQEEMFKEIKKYVDEGVTLSMIGLGMGNYKDTTMEQLANKGNGNYYYIDTIKESRKVFGEQLDGTLQVIAKDVKIQVEFDKKAVKSYRLIGYENRDIADKDFRDDKVDAGEIGAGHTVTALYEVVLDESSASTIATVRIRHKKPDGYKATENSFPMKRNMLTSNLSDSSKDLQFAAAVAGFAEILRESPYAKDLNLALVKEIAQSATSPSQLDRLEFIELVEKAEKIKR
ncbi:MAG: von Willebrand factor type A domain-containing protein [Myxococcota bacterium]|nr:von Willebrand factor type A domain-containing protein [Myxococcota bacterium]